ncbi:MAG TPA: aldehyde dehydrogenase family protein [Polyangiaceae bacterium]|nr:aldehyde dehydrogenase family protein [Polyangiaceae bacterium]
MFRTTNATELHDLFAAQKRASRDCPYPTLAERLDALRALRETVRFVRAELAGALAADFGHHDPSIGLLWELGGVIARIGDAAAHLEEWMRASPRAVDPSLGDSTAEVRYQPKGVVGNMVPWNFPVDISLGPLVDILAAGNRAIVKPSELAPNCAELVRRAVEHHFDPALVAVVTGDVDLAERFASLPWDHLLYTGSPAIAKRVLASAAEHLTPVTLELGGKCPVIVLSDRVNEDTFAEILSVKTVKGGQMCIAPDYMLVPEADLERAVSLLSSLGETMLAPGAGGSPVTGMIHDRHYDRLVRIVSEARMRGARVVELGKDTADRARRHLPMTLIVDPDDDLLVMKEEIFGPVLPIKPYRSLEQAVRYVNDRDRPLALYVFTDDAAAATRVLAETASGGASVNAIATQAAVPSLPFGGIGRSGMGCHHGREGFLTFSHARAVFRRGTENAWALMRPPYGDALAAVAAFVVDGQ